MVKKLTLLLGFALALQVNTQAQRVHKKFTLPKEIKTTEYQAQTVVFQLKKGVTYNPQARTGNSQLSKIIARTGASDVNYRFGFTPNENPNTRKSKQSEIDLNSILEIKIPQGKNIEDVINELYASNLVEFAEPKYIAFPLHQPNDPMADSLTGGSWHLHNIKAYEAWNDPTNRGDSTMVVGIVDMGDNRTNLDLTKNIFNNPGEMGLDGNNQDKKSNGIDDDNNGYIDDFQGWDFGNNDNNPEAGIGGKQHGVMVAGMAAARANNNFLMVGSGYNCKYVETKVAANGSGSIAYGYDGLKYLVDLGIKVVNLSWGNFYHSKAEQLLVNWAVLDKDVLITAGGGNQSDYQKTWLFYPASYDNVYSIGYTDVNDSIPQGNYNKKIDFVAPGFGIGSLNYTDATMGWGSSFAAPLVAGAAAALRFKYPSYSALQIGEILRTTSDNIDLKNAQNERLGNYGAGRMNMEQAFKGITTKSVRYTTYSAALDANKKLSLAFEFRNLLLPTSNLNIKATIVNGKGLGLDTILVKGALNTNVTFNNTATPFVFQLNNSYKATDSIHVKITYQDGAYQEDEYFYFVFPISKMNLNTDLVNYSIYSNGLVVNEFNPIGWVYAGNPFLYEGGVMVASSPTKVSSMVRGTNSYKTNFSAVSDLLPVNDARFDTLVSNYISDANNVNKVGVEINQRSYFWRNNVLSKSFVLELRVRNTSGATLDSVGVGYFLDEDVANYETNKTDYDASRKLAYAYSGQYTAPYGGLRLLTNQKANFYAFDQSNVVDPTNINTGNGFSDADKFKALSSGIARANAGVAGMGNDIAYTYGATVYNLKPNEEQIVAIAFVVGDDLADLQAASDSVYKQFKIAYTSPTPSHNAVKVCKLASTTLSPAGGSEFNFYKTAVNPANIIADSVASVNVNLGVNDSTFYITNIDSLFESKPLALNVSVEKLNPNFTVSEDLGAQGKQNFIGTGVGINNWNWNFGDNNTGNIQNPSNIFPSMGNYNVKLITTSAGTCKDSITKTVNVTNFLTGLENNRSELTVSPNPAKNTITIASGKNIVESVEIIDILGKSYYKSNSNSSSIDVSELNNGIYFVKLKTNKEDKIVKILISK